MQNAGVKSAYEQIDDLLAPINTKENSDIYTEARRNIFASRDRGVFERNLAQTQLPKEWQNAVYTIMEPHLTDSAPPQKKVYWSETLENVPESAARAFVTGPIEGLAAIGSKPIVALGRAGGAAMPWMPKAEQPSPPLYDPSVPLTETARGKYGEAVAEAGRPMIGVYDEGIKERFKKDPIGVLNAISTTAYLGGGTLRTLGAMSPGRTGAILSSTGRGVNIAADTLTNPLTIPRAVIQLPGTLSRRAEMMRANIGPAAKTVHALGGQATADKVAGAMELVGEHVPFMGNIRNQYLATFGGQWDLLPKERDKLLSTLLNKEESVLVSKTPNTPYYRSPGKLGQLNEEISDLDKVYRRAFIQDPRVSTQVTDMQSILDGLDGQLQNLNRSRLIDASALEKKMSDLAHELASETHVGGGVIRGRVPLFDPSSPTGKKMVSPQFGVDRTPYNTHLVTAEQLYSQKKILNERLDDAYSKIMKNGATAEDRLNIVALMSLNEEIGKQLEIMVSRGIGPEEAALFVRAGKEQRDKLNARSFLHSAISKEMQTPIVNESGYMMMVEGQMLGGNVNPGRAVVWAVNKVRGKPFSKAMANLQSPVKTTPGIRRGLVIAPTALRKAGEEPERIENPYGLTVSPPVSAVRRGPPPPASYED